MNNQDPTLKISVYVSMFYFICLSVPGLVSLM